MNQQAPRNPMPLQGRAASRGFTLLEVMFAMAIVGVAILASVTTVCSSLRNSNATVAHAYAHLAAHQAMEMVYRDFQRAVHAEGARKADFIQVRANWDGQTEAADPRLQQAVQEIVDAQNTVQPQLRIRIDELGWEGTTDEAYQIQVDVVDLRSGGAPLVSLRNVVIGLPN